jgi:hypothetical protein
MKKKKSNKKSTKGKFVKRYWEHLKGSEYARALGVRQRGSGIYVLYNKNGGVYYIGISRRSLRGRIRRHWNSDKHKGKWRTFSFYQIKRKKLIKDVESLLLRIYPKPLGNRKPGVFPPKYNLAKK